MRRGMRPGRRSGPVRVHAERPKRRVRKLELEIYRASDASRRSSAGMYQYSNQKQRHTRCYSHTPQIGARPPRRPGCPPCPVPAPSRGSSTLLSPVHPSSHPPSHPTTQQSKANMSITTTLNTQPLPLPPSANAKYFGTFGREVTGVDLETASDQELEQVRRE